MGLGSGEFAHGSGSFVSVAPRTMAPSSSFPQLAFVPWPGL
jgi:hypothetical protein